MFRSLRMFRNPLGALTLASCAVLAACQPTASGLGGAFGGSNAVQVAMLLPVTSGQPGDALISRSLENAARLAIGDLVDTEIEITLYDTAGDPATAAAVAQQAVSEGADVIVGPLRSNTVAAVGVAVANTNISVLSFSNNTEIAGGNVFVLGHTFQNTADRVMAFAARQGRSPLVLVHADNLAGQVARDAVLSAATTSGIEIAQTVGFEFSQTGVINAVPEITAAVRDTDASGLMLTADSSGALPFFAELLPENGLDTEEVQVMGLARWDTPPQTLEFDGLQGGWFAVPDPAAAADFNVRYEAIYEEPPHFLGALGYDAMRIIGTTQATVGSLTPVDLTASPGFEGANGVVRLRADGTNQRAMAIAQVIDNQVAFIDPAPRRLGAGF